MTASNVTFQDSPEQISQPVKPAMFGYRGWLLLATAILLISTIVGLFIPINLERLIPFDQVVGSLGELHPAVLFIIILLNNLRSLVLSFFLSPLLLLGPLLTLGLNGLIIGNISSLVVEQQSLGFLVIGLLPHGIFEIPSLIIAEAAALSFGFVVIRSIFNRDLRPQVFPSFIANLKYLAIALALLVPAALIETFVTPVLLDSF